MKLSIAQLDISYKNPSENIRRVRELFAEADSVGDLVILPELFTTGYLFNNAREIHGLCEDFSSSATVNALSSLAKKHNTVIVAGMAEVDNGHYFNTVAVIGAQGLKHKYRKISQTNIDRQYFSRGTELLTFRHMGVHFGVAICFDLWFPEIIREYARAGVDVLLHPANFGGPQTLRVGRARAIENSMLVATCNRTGREVTRAFTGDYCGRSQICAPSGDYLLRLESEDQLATVELSVAPEAAKKIIGVPLVPEIEAIAQRIDKKTQSLFMKRHFN